MPLEQLELAFYKALQKYNATMGFLTDTSGTLWHVTDMLAKACETPVDTVCANSHIIEELLAQNNLSWPLKPQGNGTKTSFRLTHASKSFLLHQFTVSLPSQAPLIGCAITETNGFEQMYRTLFDAGSNGMLIHKPNGVIVDANAMACQIFGLSNPQLVGWNLRHLTKTELEEVFDNDISPLPKKSIKQYEFTYARPDGVILEIEAHSQLFNPTNDDLIFTEIKDVTPLRQNEQRIKMLLTAIEQSPSSIVITDTNGIIEYVNPQFTEVTGYTPHEAIGQNPKVLKTDFTPIETYTSLWQTLQSGQVWQGEFVNKKKDGSIYYEDAIISPITNKEGKTVHYLAIKHDISKLKKQSQDLKVYVARLNALIESTSDRIWSIDNDLNITAINSHFKNDFLTAFGVNLAEGVYCMLGNPKPIEEEWIKRYRRALNGEVFSTEDYFDLPSIKKWVATNFNPIVSEGQIIGAALFSRDISASKQNELNHLANQVRLKSLIDNTSDNIWSVDETYHILAVNTHMQTAFNLSYGFELKHGTNILDPLPAEHKTVWKVRYDRALGGECFSEVDYFEINGRPLYSETSFNPIDIGGTIQGVSCFARDITSQKVYEQSLVDSEQQLNTIFNTVESGICVVDVELKQITYVNGYLAQLMNWEKGKLIGLPASILKFKNNISYSFETSLSNIPDVLVTSNLTEIPVVRSQSVITIKNKPFILHSLIDISAQKQQEQIIIKLNASALKLISFKSLSQIHRYLRHEIVSYLPDSLVLLNLFDASNNTMKIKAIESINSDLLAKLKEYFKESPVGMSLAIPEHVVAQLKKGQLFEREDGLRPILLQKFKEKTLDELRAALSITKIYSIGISYQNNIFGSIVIMMRNNKTIDQPYYIETLMYQASVAWQRNMLEHELMDAKTEAEKANSAKSAFVANLGHEIRTPLNAVIGLSDILYKNAQDPKSQNYLAAIISSGKTVLNIINDLLDLSKLEAGEMVIRPQPTDIKTLFDEMRHIFALKANEKGIDFRITVNNCLPTHLNIDDLRIRQVLLNLLDNALKFTHDGYLELKVGFEPKSATTINLNIQVIDTGIGIKPEMQQKVFLAFRQQDEQDNRKYGGTGLGLAISLKLVKMMGGQIHLASEPGKGSCFTIVLPNIEILGPNDTSTEWQQHESEAQSDLLSNEKPRLLPLGWDGNLTVLKELLSSEILPLIGSFSTKPSLQDAELFSQIIISVGENFGVDLFVKTGLALQNEVTNFDIIEMRHTLKNIKDICTRLLDVQDL